MLARVLLLLTLLMLPRVAAAQGVTTAAIQGTVSAEDGTPVPGATIQVVNLSNGRRWEVGASAAGRFLLEDVAIGGPYRIEARALGFAPEAKTGIILALGQRLVADFGLRPMAIELAPVTVTAMADPVLSPGRTGPAEIVSGARIAETPNPGRDFLTLTTLSPHAIMSPSSGSAATGGITIGGQNRLLNSFQIDGGTNHDPYTGRLPGRETLPRPISLQAVEEIQVLAAPFDVRHGAFAGGLVNAVTRSGGNAVHGSVFGFLQDNALSGAGVTGKLDDFTTWQGGGAVGGPILRDRAHYFLSVDVQHRIVPDPGPLITDTVGGADTARIGIRYASAVRFQEILRDSFGLDPGTLGPVDGRQPAQDVFGKITVQLGTNNHLEASHHYAHGDRESFAGRRAALYVLSSTRHENPSTANASRLIWTGLIGGRWSHELIVSYLRLRDACWPDANYPAIVVRPVDQGALWAGPQGACAPTSVVQDALELTENVTVGFGSHVVTLGVHGEALHFRDELLPGSTGNWMFLSLDNFAAGRASRYARTLPGPLRTGGVDFRSRRLDVYMQDRWTLTARLALTLGLRVDLPFLPDAVATNDSLQAALGIDTGRLPGGTPLWSPRLGINYDLGGDGRGYLRGGIGLFSGRPPYSWLASAYRDNGSQELFLECRGARVPRFDPVNQPVTCADGMGPRPRLSYFDPDVKFPQNLKLALGFDHRLPGGLVGTVDVLYTQAVHQLYFTDANLLAPVGVAQGEGNRPLYGTIDATGAATPARRNPAFGQVIRVSNKGGDHALSLSAQLRKRFGEWVEASAFYAYTRTRDRMSLVNYPARANLEHTPLDGTLEDRALRTSYFEVPHRVQLGATVRLPHRISLSVLYAGASGTPYTYVITGDANADGIPTGQFVPDIVYVPRDSLDISLDNPADWARLNAVIEGEPCLREQRGRILERNSCRNPWFGTLNARLTKAFATVGGQSVELTADVYNVLNLLNRRWGLYRVTAPTPAWPLLQLAPRYDTNAQRGIYQLNLPTLRDVRDLEGRWSRWLVELGVRYVF